MRTSSFAETFEVDISNTKKLLEGERGQLIAQKDVIVSIFFDMGLVKRKRMQKDFLLSKLTSVATLGAAVLDHVIIAILNCLTI